MKETIDKIRGEIAAKKTELEGVADSDSVGTAEGLARLKELTAELNAAHERLEAALAAQKALGRAALPANENSASGVPAQPAERLTAEQKVGIAIGALLKRNQDPSRSAFAYMDEMGFGFVAREFADFRAKAQNASNAVSGGILVPTDMANEIVEILRPNTTFLQVPGMVRIPMPNGNYKLPAGATGASASYQQEADPASVTGITFRDVELSAKTLTAIIPVTNDLLNFSISGAMAFVQNDLRRAMAQKMDSMLWRGDGTAGNPTGIMKIPGVTAIADTNSSTPSYTQVDAFARQLINALINSYIPQGSWAWVMPTLVTGYLQDLRSSVGNPIYPTMQGAIGQKSFKGYPVLETTNFPLTLNTRGSSNETEIALVAGEHVVFGESMPLELAVSSEAAIEVGGQVQSLFQRRMTAVLAVMQHDVDLRHLGAIAVGTGVEWGH